MTSIIEDDQTKQIWDDLVKLVTRRRKVAKPFVRQLAFQVAQHRRSGFCPCCQAVRILDESGQPLPGTELDHWYAPDKNGFDEMWPVCRECNMKLTNSQFKSTKTAIFLSFRDAVRQFFNKQQLLFP